MTERKRGFKSIKGYTAVLPKRKTKGSAGYDISVPQRTVLPAGKLTVVGTGLKAYMLDDEYLAVHIRSSMAIKRDVIMVNGTGIIDSDYYNNADNDGHIQLPLLNLDTKDIVLEKGERVAQGIFMKYLLTDDDSSTDTRNGGIGSTGK